MLRLCKGNTLQEIPLFKTFQQFPTSRFILPTVLSPK